MADPAPSPSPRRWRHLRFHGRRAATPTDLYSDGAVLKAGFLLKKGHRMPTTKDRYFVLKSAGLSYYKSPRDAPAADTRHLRGVIHLSPSDLITPISTSRHWFFLQQRVGADGKPYKLELRASSPAERQEWIDALRRAVAGTASSTATAAQLAQQAERDRRLTQTLTMLRVRDPTLLATVLHQSPAPPAPMVDLRASFQVFHELLLLQTLVAEIQATWGAPTDWTCEQYDQLVDAIALTATQERGNATASVLATARALQYAFEEVPENQQKLLARQHANSIDGDGVQMRRPSMQLEPVGRVRCPTIYSYLSTFEHLQETTSTASSSITAAPLSPRSATLAKYAHMYLEEEGRTLKPWTPERVPTDELIVDPGSDTDQAETIAKQLAERCAFSRVYTSLGARVLLFLNPRRLLKTATYTSIYDEQVVLLYAQTPFAQAQLQPHPFAVAKHALLRLQLGASPRHVLQLVGESGSGKTELAKELLKYVVLTSTSSSSSTGDSSPKVVLFTSSTKSTSQMRSDERRTLDLLQAQGITTFEVVLLDVDPSRWQEMTRVSHSKRLPQLHVGGHFFGFYETLQRLQDEEQLSIFLRNPHVANKLRAVLDGNLLVEAMAHASTPANANSSRYAKTVDVQLRFKNVGRQLHEVVGAVLTPTLLEKSRVTDGANTNFHILYTLANGVSVGRNHQQLAKTLLLDGKSSDDFQYLRRVTAGTRSRSKEEDAERLRHVLEAMANVEMDTAAQEGVLRVLSAVLWLGNVQFADAEGGVGLGFTEDAGAVHALVAVLGLSSREQLLTLLTRRRLTMRATKEAIAVVLSRPQAEHMRDAVARALYSAVFQHVVRQLNRVTTDRATKAEDKRTLRVVDLFGFEDFGGRSSLEQLCVNYLTEKLAAAEAHAQMNGLDISPQSGAVEHGVVKLYEHPLGVFATLEEQTLLHQSEDEVDGDQQKKNERFVRYLHQRNPESVETQVPLHQRALRFVIPHTRSVVQYDATDFVKKNADSVQPAALKEALAGSGHACVRIVASELDRGGDQPVGGGAQPSSTERSGSGSMVAQFRAQVAQLVGDVADAVFLHCLRPNVGGGGGVDVDAIQRQIQAHRVHQFSGHAASPKLGEITMDTRFFKRRYSCLGTLTTEGSVEEVSEMARLCEALDRVLRSSLTSSMVEDSSDALVWRTETGVRLCSLQVAEMLELLRFQRETQAATTLQARQRMRVARTWYIGVRALRQSLARDLLAIYGPQSIRKVERTLRKYQGDEAALVAKIQAKRQEQKMLAELTDSMAVFASSVGVDASRLERVLADGEVQKLVAEGGGRVLAALREMSLDPQGVLPRQLCDPVLRTFYQRLMVVLQTTEATSVSQEEEEEEGGCGVVGGGDTVSLTMEERVRRLVASRRGLWRRVAERSAYEEIRERLEEIGDEPEMLLFYLDDDAFAGALKQFVAEMEGMASEGEEDAADEAEQKEKREDLATTLSWVAFTPTLMAAMQGDPFFVRALESPRLVRAVHQLMTDREAFAASREALLADAELHEFFTRLVRLSASTQRV